MEPLSTHRVAHVPVVLELMAILSIAVKSLRVPGPQKGWTQDSTEGSYCGSKVAVGAVSTKDQ